MPIIECGPAPFAPFGGALLANLGPTVLIDVGFDPAIIAQMGAASAAQPGAAPGLPPPAPITSSPQMPPPTPLASKMQNVPALIDTGAKLSCIDDALAQQLQLPLINQAQSGGVLGVGLLNVYLAYIAIPGLGAVQAGEFTGAIMTGQARKALIGRTLLQNMLLIYDGRSGSVKLAS